MLCVNHNFVKIHILLTNKYRCTFYLPESQAPPYLVVIAENQYIQTATVASENTNQDANSSANNFPMQFSFCDLSRKHVGLPNDLSSIYRLYSLLFYLQNMFEVCVIDDNIVMFLSIN